MGYADNQQGKTEDFVIGGTRDLVYSGNVGAIVPKRTVNGALFEGVLGACSSGKISEILGALVICD